MKGYFTGRGACGQSATEAYVFMSAVNESHRDRHLKRLPPRQGRRISNPKLSSNEVNRSTHYASENIAPLLFQKRGDVSGERKSESLNKRGNFVKSDHNWIGANLKSTMDNTGTRERNEKKTTNELPLAGVRQATGLGKSSRSWGGKQGKSINNDDTNSFSDGTKCIEKNEFRQRNSQYQYSEEQGKDTEEFLTAREKVFPFLPEKFSLCACYSSDNFSHLLSSSSESDSLLDKYFVRQKSSVSRENEIEIDQNRSKLISSAASHTSSHDSLLDFEESIDLMFSFTESLDTQVISNKRCEKKLEQKCGKICC